jgi:hypothetical protein
LAIADIKHNCQNNPSTTRKLLAQEEGLALIVVDEMVAKNKFKLVMYSPAQKYTCATVSDNSVIAVIINDTNKSVILLLSALFKSK